MTDEAVLHCGGNLWDYDGFCGERFPEIAYGPVFPLNCRREAQLRRWARIRDMRSALQLAHHFRDLDRDSDIDDIRDVWYLTAKRPNKRAQFCNLVATLTERDVFFCADCQLPSPSDGSWAYRDGSVCDDCRDAGYFDCENCEDLECHDRACTVEDEYGYQITVCARCYTRERRTCEVCNVAYIGENSRHADCGQDCDCEAPHLDFSFPNDGHGTVDNDDRFDVQLGGGEISDMGLAQIEAVVDRRAGPWRVVREIGPEAQASAGNFTKRLQKAIHKHQKAIGATTPFKLMPDEISAIGNYAAQHSSKDATYSLELTRDLNLPAEDFANDSSCWWDTFGGDRPSGALTARCQLKTCGGFAIRSWANGYLDGRAWVIPLRVSDDGESFSAIHETDETTDAYVIFNSYGNLSMFTAPRILAHMTGKSYRKVTFAPDIYINGQYGYLVADADLCARFASVQLRNLRTCNQ